MKNTLYTGVASRLPVDNYDVVVIGTGIAGLYTALHLSAEKKVALLTKVNIEDCNSWLAQGGMAAVLTKEDKLELLPCDDMLDARPKYSVLDNMMIRISHIEEPAEWKAALKEYLTGGR